MTDTDRKGLLAFLATMQFELTHAQSNIVKFKQEYATADTPFLRDHTSRMAAIYTHEVSVMERLIGDYREQFAEELEIDCCDIKEDV